MNHAPESQTGLALGAWGAVQASAAGIAIALGGILRDVVAGVMAKDPRGAAFAYDVVYAIEVILLFVTLFTMLPLLRRRTAPGRARYSDVGTSA
jgi:MFS transporter, BCD family, chlorophyll transporter